MSRGSGHVERAIAETFARYPSKAFSIGELCLLVWPTLAPSNVKHKHRTSVLRAAAKVAPAAGWQWHGFVYGDNRTVYAGPLASENEIQEARRRFSVARTIELSVAEYAL
jgi:hypothetical protein